MKSYLFSILALLIFAAACPAQRNLPNPVLNFASREHYQVSGKEFVRYRYTVFNYQDFPAELFAAAPELPPCGKNTNASRTWVDVFDSRGKRLYGFCAFTKPADLNGIWFAIPADATPPSWVYIELSDRKTNTKYKSNLAETVP